MAEIEIVWSRRALSDIEEIISFISRDSEQYAVNFASKIVETVETLRLFPGIGRVVPEYSDPGIRELIYRNYRVVYKIEPGFVEIATVFQGSRLLE
jgi:plasmid stabilization system protein ParE